MKRTPIRRVTPLARSGKLKPKKRSAGEFSRIYGSKARASWVKDQPCWFCVACHPVFMLVRGKSHNAHSVTGGMGRKAGYETIVPLCASHHRRYDEYEAPFDDPRYREMVKAMAPLVETAWQAYQGRTPSAGEPAGAKP